MLTEGDCCSPRGAECVGHRDAPKGDRCPLRVGEAEEEPLPAVPDRLPIKGAQIGCERPEGWDASLLHAFKLQSLLSLNTRFLNYCLLKISVGEDNEMSFGNEMHSEILRANARPGIVRISLLGLSE